MTIDEAIERYTSNAGYERTHGNLQGCLEFRQLAEWLKELKQLREQTRWIPVSERLPKGYERVLVTRRMFHWANEPVEYTVGIESFGGNVDFIAWMPLPEPYKASPTEAEGSKE